MFKACHTPYTRPSCCPYIIAKIHYWLWLSRGEVRRRPTHVSRPAPSASCCCCPTLSRRVATSLLETFMSLLTSPQVTLLDTDDLICCGLLFLNTSHMFLAGGYIITSIKRDE